MGDREDVGALGDEGGGINKMGENSIGKYSFGDNAIGGRAYIIGDKEGTGTYAGEGSSGRAHIGLSDDGRKLTFSMAESSIE